MPDGINIPESCTRSTASQPNPRKKFQAERMAARAERIRQLHAQGLSNPQIAAKIGNVSAQSVGKQAQRLGLKGQRGANARLQITHAEYLAEKALGWSDDAMGAARGVTRSAIAHKAKREGWR